MHLQVLKSGLKSVPLFFRVLEPLLVQLSVG